MSQKSVLDDLDEQLQTTAMFSGTRLIVVFGYPRSDLGKGTLVSRILTMLEDKNVIKFDGLLNSNVDGRFTDRGHDDFGLYEKQNPGLKITKLNHLLGGDLLTGFIREYGETNERLTLIPHLAHFFRLELQRRWRMLGEPRNLILEMGGTPDDSEVDYALAAIREIKAEFGRQCQILLLTELGHNNLFVKSKVAQRGVNELVSRGLVPDIILAREPYLEQTVSVSERFDFEIQLQDRIAERTGIQFNNIIAVPYFTKLEFKFYQPFLERNLLPLLQGQGQSPSILIATTDPPEIEEWHMLLGGQYHLVEPAALGLDIEIGQNNSSLLRSSSVRARTFRRASGLSTIATAVGLYLNALGGKPGVGVRTWGGDLPAVSNNQELFELLQRKLGALEDTRCYLERSVTLVLANGEERHFSQRYYGTIDKQNLARGYRAGQYPIGLIFKYDQYGVTWAEMDDTLKKQARGEMLTRILGWMQYAYLPHPML